MNAYSAAQIYANYAYAYYKRVFCVYAYVYRRTYTRICLFVMHSHTFLYMKHSWSNKRPVIFMGMKKASKRNLHIVKTSCQSMKAIIFRVFDHFANSPTNLLDLNLPKMGRKLKQSLFQHVNVMFLQGKFCVSACVGKSFAKCLLSEFCIL